MSDTTLIDRCKKNLSIVVVEPQGSLNVGAIARVMKNMGLSQLVLVNPQCDCFGEAAQRMAVHAKDILAQAKVVDSLAIALANCQRVIATTARERTLQSPLEPPRQALPWLLADVPSALVFGREDHGLSNDELNQAHRFVKIPVDPSYAALNLAQAVAVCAYELHQASLELSPLDPLPPVTVSPTAIDEGRTLASAAMLDSYYQHLEKTLLNIQVLYPHTAAARMAKLKRIYQRSGLGEDEVALLRGILGQVDWLSQQLTAQSSHCQQPPGE